MSYQFLGHTADVKLKVEGKNFADLLIDAANGLFDFLTPEGFEPEEKTKDYNIVVESVDRAALVVDLLSDLLCIAHTDKVILADFAISSCSDNKIELTAVGYKVSEFRDDIKGITYHGAEVKELENGDLTVTITFDI